MGESARRIRSSVPGSLRRPASSRSRWLGALAVVAVTVLPPLAASAADQVQPLLDRIDRLERDLRTLNIRVARGAGAAGAGDVSASAPADVDSTGSLARMDVRVTDLEEEVRGLTGKIETIEFSVRRMNDRLDKLVNDVDYRLRTLEGGNPGQPPSAAASGAAAGAMAGATTDAPAAATPPRQIATQSAPASDMSRPASGPGVFGTLSSQEASNASRQNAAPMTPDVPQTGARGADPTAMAAPSGNGPDDKYRQAFTLLRQQRYPEAEAALREFIDTNPSNDLASNARYWLGETHYVRAQYAQAAQVFLESYTKDPKGKKAPDSLLKLGMSLSNLDKKREACAAYGKLDKEFPDAPSNIKKIAAREREQSGCR